jgi:hypothetical protein
MSTTNVRNARGHHVWPWPEQARWQAHRQLNAGEGVKQTEGKWSLDLGLPATTRKPRREGREGGAYREGALLWRRMVRGRRSGRGG